MINLWKYFRCPRHHTFNITMLSKFSILTILVAIVGVVSIPSLDVVLKPVSSEGPEVSLLLIQGADIKPEQYIPLAKEIQLLASKTFKLWVGIPQFPGNAAEPLVLDKGIERTLATMTEQGMNTTTLVMAGHSLGGAMVQTWTADHPERVSAQVLMGAFITRTFKKDYVFSYPVPTLTIAGELDGLARITRMAEAYYTQILDPTQNSITGGDKFPVTAIEGMSHMQFASGTPPSLVLKRDLRPEISYETAHTLVAKDILTYLTAQLKSDKTAQLALRKRLSDTQSLINPILDALHLEGYHNFRPPCLCATDICPESPTCTASCPFTSAVSQVAMGQGLEGVTIQNADSFHDVWETEPTVHLPQVLNQCSFPDGCVLSTTTVTQGVYHNGEDLEIWKKHFDVAWLDLGFFPISAVELRTKMNSRQSIHSHAGIKDASFDDLDGGHTRCAEINQKSIDWANSNVAARTASRFSQSGQSYVVGSDLDVCPAGPCWIWEELHYTPSEDGSKVELTSPQFSTATDFWLPKTRGFHYCKVLSPARAVEWMYVDGLRAKLGLNTTA